MLLLFAFFLPCAVCLVALPSLMMKLHRLSSDRFLIAVCVCAAVYFLSSVYSCVAELKIPLSSFVLTSYPEWLIFLGAIMGVVSLPLIYMWEGRVTNVRGLHVPLLFVHLRDREWSARDQYLMRADVAVMVGVGLEIIRNVIIGLHIYAPICLAILSVIQAGALYVFYASAIYLGIIDNPAVNRETLRSVQQARQSELRTAFLKLMDEQQPYLKQGITIEDVSLMLGTNRTYLSRMLHDDFACSFPEYINERRLSFSQQFMQEHPHEVQEEVAFRCGFSNASAYNKKFKERYGSTPREWLITNRQS